MAETGTSGILGRWPAAVAVIALVLVSVASGGCGSGGDPTADAATDPAAAREAYREYLIESAESVKSRTAELQKKAEANLIEEAKSQFAASEVPLGHLKPVLTLSNVSEPLLTPPDGAYPMMERALWEDEDGAKAAEAASQATELMERLVEQLRAAPLTPENLAGNGRRTIDEILTLDLGLEGDPYSHHQILNASANLEGVKATFEAFRPALVVEDPQVPGRIERELNAAFSAIEEFGVPAAKPEQTDPELPGTSFISGTLVTPRDLHAVHAPVKKLAALFNRSLKAFLEPSARGDTEE